MQQHTPCLKQVLRTRPVREKNMHVKQYMIVMYSAYANNLDLCVLQHYNYRAHKPGLSFHCFCLYRSVVRILNVDIHWQIGNGSRWFGVPILVIQVQLMRHGTDQSEPCALGDLWLTSTPEWIWLFTDCVADFKDIVMVLQTCALQKSTLHTLLASKLADQWLIMQTDTDDWAFKTH